MLRHSGEKFLKNLVESGCFLEFMSGEEAASRFKFALMQSR